VSGESGYQFVEGATSDLALEAHGATLGAVFAAAADALSELSRPCMGSRTTQSQARRARRPSPLSSPPITSTSGSA